MGRLIEDENSVYLELMDVFPKIFEPVSKSKGVPERCVNCIYHACGGCPYANDYMKRTHGYSLMDLYNPNSELNNEWEKCLEKGE